MIEGVADGRGRQRRLQRPAPCRGPRRPPRDLQARPEHRHPDRRRHRGRRQLGAGAVRPQGREAGPRQGHRADPRRRATRVAAATWRGSPTTWRCSRIILLVLAIVAAAGGFVLAPDWRRQVSLLGVSVAVGAVVTADRLSPHPLGGGRSGHRPGHSRRRRGHLGHVPRRPANHAADRRRRRGDPRRRHPLGVPAGRPSSARSRRRGGV